MIADATAHTLARDLAAMREIAHAALDVIATQQRRIDTLTQEKLKLLDEVRTLMGVTTRSSAPNTCSR